MVPIIKTAEVNNMNPDYRLSEYRILMFFC
jgi:hypothetical protein